MARTLFRIVQTDPPSLDDFVSNAAKGRVPPRSLTPARLRHRDGLSVFDAPDHGQQLARVRPTLGRYVATLRVPEGALVHSERTHPDTPGHFTVWGDPADMLNLVTQVVPVGAPAVWKERP